jgi:DNA-binding NtrC family response regulator
MYKMTVAARIFFNYLCMIKGESGPQLRGQRMVTVLVADDDVDSYKLVNDILEINFREVQIERALNRQSFFVKLQQFEKQIDLILLNPDLENGSREEILEKMREINPELMDRVVLIGIDSVIANLQGPMYHIPKPYSLDCFGEVVKKACCKAY